MVWQYGMGDKGLVGDFTVIPDQEISNNLKETLNNETLKILNDSLGKVEKALKKEWDLVEALAAKLVKEEEADYDAIVELFKMMGREKEIQAAGPLLDEPPNNP